MVAVSAAGRKTKRRRQQKKLTASSFTYSPLRYVLCTCGVNPEKRLRSMTDAWPSREPVTNMVPKKAQWPCMQERYAQLVYFVY
jgi:hypothetical protein